MWPLTTAECKAWPRGAICSVGRFGSAPDARQQLDDLEVSGGCGVTQGRAGAGIVGDVVRETVYQRRVLLEQLAHALQLAHEAGGADIDVGAARAEMQPHIGWRGRPVSRHVAPA